MNNFKKFMKNSKAISPIFATLILIAIAVIAGVVVYMFTSGTLATMTGGGTAAQEKVSVQGFALNAAPGTVTAYAQSINGLDVTVNAIIVKDTSGATIGQFSGLSASLPKSGALTAVTGATFTGNSTALVSGNYYTLTLVSTKGGNFVSSSAAAS